MVQFSVVLLTWLPMMPPAKRLVWALDRYRPTKARLTRKVRSFSLSFMPMMPPVPTPRLPDLFSRNQLPLTQWSSWPVGAL